MLVFNTPDHLYDKDPHKGYCVPYGSFAMKALGEKSGAYEPVVGSDLANFLPENIKRFDAIVLNNTAVPWINRSLKTFPQAWVRSYGKGRVFYTGLGHRAELYRNPAILQFYLDAIQFACGDLPAPTQAPLRTLPASAED